MNRKTVPLTGTQYAELIKAIKQGFSGCRPNIRAATALVTQANTGLRIGDVLRLKLSDIVKDGNRYHFEIKEQKTGKQRTFTMATEVYNYLSDYAQQNNISPADRLFAVSERQVQSIISRAADYCGFNSISTHSFRKYFATQIYKNNGYDVILVQHLLQHSSPAITQKYIGLEPQAVEQALINHVKLL